MKTMMAKTERVLAALNCDEVDRTPISLWSFAPHVDQNPRALAEAHVAFAKKYDLDFIKLSPFAFYAVEDWGCKIKYHCTPQERPVLEGRAVNAAEDWQKLRVLPGEYGTLGKQVQFAQHVYKAVGNTIPFIQIIYSPLTTAHNLAGDRLFDDMRNDPAMVHAALQVIADTTINFIRANIEAGVSGFFFATKCASHAFMSEQEYDAFGVKYDLQLIHEYKDKTFFNVLHIHGDNLMFEKLVSYPCNCLNWSDRWVKPSLKEARTITAKCLMGGLHEDATLPFGAPAEVKAEVEEAIRALNNKGLIIGPGCVADLRTPEANFYAARLAVEMAE